MIHWLSRQITWNLFFTTSSGWHAAFENVPAANPQRNSWKLDTESSSLPKLRWEYLYLFHVCMAENTVSKIHFDQQSKRGIWFSWQHVFNMGAFVH